jgi:DHA2 family multidrug resistance protein
VSYYNPAMHAITGALPSLRTLTGLNATVTQQAAMIAYNDDFQMMLVLSIAAIPLVLLFRKGARQSIEAVAVD